MSETTSLTEEMVVEYAEEDAQSIIDLVRSETGPIVWITSNNFMPPLRAYGHADEVWQEDGLGYWEQVLGAGGLWALYAETVIELVEKANILLDSPEYDNALYCVDLNKWQHRDDAEDADDLNEEWEPA